MLFVSAHFSFVALKQVIAMKAGRCSAMNWRRPPGLDVLERHGYRYSRLVMEQQPAGDRRGRMQRNVDIVESHRNGPQPSMRHDDDDDCLDWWLLHSLCFILISDKPWVYSKGLKLTATVKKTLAHLQQKLVKSTTAGAWFNWPWIAVNIRQPSVWVHWSRADSSGLE